MDLKVYEPKEEKIKAIILRLFEEDDMVELWVVDKTGVRIDEGHIADISEDGIHRMGDLNPKLGFELDDEDDDKIAMDE